MPISVKDIQEKEFSRQKREMCIRDSHAGGEFFHGLLDGRAALPRLGALGGFDDHQAHAGGEVARIHRVDARHLARGKAGVLVASGHFGADGDVDDLAAVRRKAAEKPYVVFHADRRGL